MKYSAGEYGVSILFSNFYIIVLYSLNKPCVWPNAFDILLQTVTKSTYKNSKTRLENSWNFFRPEEWEPWSSSVV